MAARHKSVETKYYEMRDKLITSLPRLDRRDFFKVMGATGMAAAIKGLFPPHSFQLLEVANAMPLPAKGDAVEKFTFAYISDSHLYEEKLNDQFIRAIMRGIDDVNRLDPQPDFVLFGGDLAQLGQAAELEIGAQLLKEVKAPIKMMVGEHDWYLDMGAKWKELFGEPNYSFDHKGVHFVVLNSVVEKDFWTARGLTPMERMKTVAGLDNSAQSAFEVGEVQRMWMQQDLAKVDKSTPVIVFSHSPLYKYYRNWNFWTDDADEVQALLRPFEHVTVIHGHTHQVLTNRIDNMHFHGVLSTAWPWPYAPEGLPKYTVQMSRANPFDPQDACGTGQVTVNTDGLCDMVYNLWDRNPMHVRASYLKSMGKKDKPEAPTFSSY
ncbi:MAG: serine/threonine protein phosphatase [Acidobacteria bacterium]|nr:serine/threonine protein phosphatase [Acidobacteriota bacterium]